MPLTFGSVGDIISLCSVIQKLVKALDESTGSSQDYKDLVADLRAFETAVKEIERLSIENSHVLEFGPLFETAGKGATQCRQEMESFLESIEQYKKHFEASASKFAIKANFAKVKWQVLKRDDVMKFRAHIIAHSQSMSLLLSAISINAAIIHKAQLERSIKDVKQSHENAVAQQRDVFQSIQTWCQRCEASFIDAVSYLKDTAQNVLQRLDWLRNSTTDIKDTVRRIFLLNFQTYGEMLRLRSVVTNHLERTPTLTSEAPWILDDCIGRVSPVHKEFIISWETFQFVLENRFHGLPGHNKVKRREYVLQDTETGEFVKREDIWERAFTPNRRYSMSILFDDRDDTEDSQCASCPNCQYVSQSASETETRWIIEEVDELEDWQQKSAKPIQKPIGPRVERKINRRKYRPWFLRKKSQNPQSGSLNMAKTQKRCRDDFESSESEPDHTSFKRIRLVSSVYATPPEHKRKKVRLHGPMKASEDQASVNENTMSSTATSAIANVETEDLDKGLNNSKSVVKTNLVHDSNLEKNFDSDSVITPSKFEALCEHFNERRYHSTYLRPNDELEADTEALLHHILLLLKDGRLYLSPVKKEGTKILDLGTGTGIWAIDVADEIPSAEVIGIDKAAIQPEWIPPNSSFWIDNIMLVGKPDDWDYPNDQYDFVHIGNLCSAVDDWKELTEAAYRSLRPGGYFEVQEFIPFPLMDETNLDVESLRANAELIPQAFSKCGIDLRAPLGLARVFKEVGFRNVQEKVTCVDAKSSKGLIRLIKYWFDTALDGLTNVPFQKGLGWTNEERKSYIARMKKMHALRSSGPLRGHFKLVVVYGSKE